MGSYYAGIMNSEYARELRHHGVKGQKWGVKNGPPYPIQSDRPPRAIDKNVLKNIKHARTANLDKWGKDAEHNTLYIAGYSGSGKSTTALGLKKPGDTVIHLDGYTEGGDDVESIQHKKFNAHLDKTVPKWREIGRSAADQSEIKRFSKEYWNIVDDFLDAINSYSTKEFKNGNRVIVEGVQLSDDWFGDPKKLSGKPIIVLGTNPISSMSRAFKRDDRGNLLKGLASLDSAGDYIKWVAQNHKNLNRLSKSTNSKRNQKYLSDFLKGQ